MKLWVCAAALGVWLLASGARGAEDDRGRAEDARLEALFREYLDATFRAEPVTATRLGEHRYDGALDDISAQARESRLARLKQQLAKLAAGVSYAQLTRAGQIDCEILQHHLEREIWLAENFKPFQDDPRIYGEYLTESVYLVLTQSTLPKEENLRHAIERMGQVGRIVEEARRSIGNPPRVKVETAIKQTQGAIGFYSDEIFQLAGETPGRGELGAQARAAAEVMKTHLDFLKSEVLPRAQGEWRIGKELFGRKLALELDAGLSAEEVLAEAEAEAKRVEREMYVLARQMWGTAFPEAPLPPDDPEGRALTVRRVLDQIASDHGTGESLAEDIRATVAQIKAFITERGILTLPEPDRCRIIEMPEFLRGNSVAYLNPSPPLDPKATSEYAISPPPAQWDDRRVESFLREYNKAMLKILTIHEAYPGHYVQLEYSHRCPSLVRRVLASGTFAEGWAVYTEQMMIDQGFGAGDPALRLQQLKFYLRSVLNALLDYRMHCTTMTDEQALDLLTRRGFQTEGEALYKIIRSKQSSCQLSTYFVGRVAFYRLRQSVQRSLGERFRLGPYHEAVLAHGTLPVKYLPELVRRAFELDNE
jgi:uncharacterized protein (DUF885 family)